MFNFSTEFCRVPGLVESVFRFNECFDYFHCSCAVDETVVFEQSPSARLVRFSLEGFKFIGDNAFVFFHCLERVCNASDPNSRCAKGCEKGQRRKRDTADSKDLYSLAQGPFVGPATDQEPKKELQLTQQGKPAPAIPRFVHFSGFWCVLVNLA